MSALRRNSATISKICWMENRRSFQSADPGSPALQPQAVNPKNSDGLQNSDFTQCLSKGNATGAWLNCGVRNVAGVHNAPNAHCIFIRLEANFQAFDPLTQISGQRGKCSKKESR